MPGRRSGGTPGIVCFLWVGGGERGGGSGGARASPLTSQSSEDPSGPAQLGGECEV